MFRTFACVLILSISFSSFDRARAQAGQAELTGEVRDPAGAMIPEAHLTALEVRTHQVYHATSGTAGVYSFPHLKPGEYTLAVEAPGFKRSVRQGVQLTTGQRFRLDVELTIGDVNDSITVQEDAPLLQTQSGTLGQLIGRRTVLDLPLNGRSFVSLITLAPGVATPPGNAFPRINGGRPRTSEYLFDGISVLQPEPGQVAFFPIIDAIQEFRVDTNSPPAEFGRFNGGVINLTTKSGTNAWHGSGFEFLRNEALNARNLFAPKTADDPGKPLFRRHQFGFVLGGPVIRDRTFFFADYQGTRQRLGVVRISNVPTVLQRQGIFTEPVSDPPRVPAIPFPENTIPQDQIDPVARALLQRYPRPTSPGTAGNYRRVGNESEDQDQFDLRIDHRFRAADQWFGRFSYAKDRTDPVTPLPDGSGQIPSGAIGRTQTDAQSLASSYLHLFPANISNEVRFGYTRRGIDRRAVQLAFPPSQSLSIPGIPADAAFPTALPTFVIAGYQSLGPPANAFSDFRTDVTQLIDTLSAQRGRHFLKAGLDFRWERLDVLQPPSPTGLFQFSAVGSGYSLASFLLGRVERFSIDLQQRTLRPRAHIQEYFLQDEWKATGRLTLLGGVRYTLNFPSTEVDDQGAVFNLTTQRLDYLGMNGFPRAARKLHKLNLGPRVGVAYRVNERTVLRSGYGLVWIEQAGITTPFTNPQFPFIQTVTQRTLDNSSPAFALSAGPTIAPIPRTPDAGLGQGVFAVDRSLGSGYAQQWNLSLQRELSRHLVFEIAYIGSKITHVGIPDTNLNQLTEEQLRLGPALLERVPNPFFGQIPRASSLGDPTLSQAQLLKPFPRFTTVSLFRNNVGNTNYHALQARLEKRLAQGLSFLLSYTRSKLIDEASSVFDAAVLTGPVANFPVADSFNRKRERDVSSGDIPYVFVFSGHYDLPFGTNKRFHPAGMVGKLLDGWQLTGIVTVQSGLPLAVTQVTNFNAFAGFGTQRPNRIGRAERPAAERTTAQFFNTSAFEAAPVFTLGNSSRNPVRGPSYRNADVALIKRTPLNERVNVEFRTEVFNLTNTPPLGPPNTVLGAPGFGSITSAGDPRVVQFALKLNF